MATPSKSKKKDTQSEQEDENEILADGFVRSRRTTEMFVRDELLSRVANHEEEKTVLIQKMNRALI